MPPQIASCVFICVIVGLFWLDQEREAQTSKALILPLIWLWQNSSRSFAEWAAILGFMPKASSSQAERYVDGNPLDRDILICLMIAAIIVLIKRGHAGR